MVFRNGWKLPLQQQVGAALPTGVGLMVLGAFWFSVMSLLVKVAGQRLPTQEIVLVRGALMLLFTSVLLRRAGIRPWGEKRKLLLTRAVLGFFALSSFYYAVVHLPLADATVIQFTNPVWTALLAAWLLGERLRRREGALIAASLAGVILIARPSFLFGSEGAGLDPTAVGVALMGAIFSAAAYVAVRQLGRTEHPLVVVFYFALVTVPAALPGAVASAIWPTPLEWAALLGVGVTAQLGQLAITRGLKLESAGRATAVGYLQIVFASLWGALFFAEYPDLWTLGGALIIMASTFALGRRSGGGGETDSEPDAPTHEETRRAA